MNASFPTFLAFAFVASITPGPNNVLAFAVGAAHGLRAAVPVVLGITLGFGFLVGVVGCGLAIPMTTFPSLHLLLRWCGLIWILVLAWKIARADGSAPDGQPATVPPRFLAAAGLQWVNPKAWILAIAATAAYTTRDENLYAQVIPLAIGFGLVSIPCVAFWAALGAGTSRLLASPRRMRAFNNAMGLLLAASAIPVIWE